jgi:hypothetical protein
LRKLNELWTSLIIILAITIFYLFIIIFTGMTLHAGDLFGHGIGILGFVLMLATEFLYSIRKRQHTARWGKMSSWLEFHIITGLVGSYMVLLHTSWTYNGLAGMTMLLTVVIVVSGFIGRYIYTAIPRTADGTEMEVVQIKEQIASIDTQMRQYFVEGKTVPKAHKVTLVKLQKNHDQLIRQMSSLATARRFMSVWHTLHIPIGAALFTAAFIHVFAVIYFVVLSR